jgi:hypothetical protein
MKEEKSIGVMNNAQMLMDEGSIQGGGPVGENRAQK